MNREALLDFVQTAELELSSGVPVVNWDVLDHFVLDHLADAPISQRLVPELIHPSVA